MLQQARKFVEEYWQLESRIERAMEHAKIPKDLDAAVLFRSQQVQAAVSFGVGVAEALNDRIV